VRRGLQFAVGFAARVAGGPLLAGGILTAATPLALAWRRPVEACGFDVIGPSAVRVTLRHYPRRRAPRRETGRVRPPDGPGVPRAVQSAL
jgi:hypothetical protein